MKCLAALLLVVLGTGTAFDQNKPSNGVWWVELSSDYKLGFVAGYAHSENSAGDLMSMQCIEEKGKQHPSPDNLTVCLHNPVVDSFDFTGIRIGQLADGVDVFYRNPRNKNLDIKLALKYVRDKLKGKSPEELELELKDFRDISARGK